MEDITMEMLHSRDTQEQTSVNLALFQCIFNRISSIYIRRIEHTQGNLGISLRNNMKYC